MVPKPHCLGAQFSKFTGVELLCELRYSIEKNKLWREKRYENPKTKDKWRDVTFTQELVPGSATIDFRVYYQGEQLAHTRAKYANDRPGPSAGEWLKASSGSSVQSSTWRIGDCIHS